MELNHIYHKNYIKNNFSKIDINILLKEDINFRNINDEDNIPKIFYNIFNKKYYFNIILYSKFYNLDLNHSIDLFKYLNMNNNYLSIKDINVKYDIDIKFIKNNYDVDYKNIFFKINSNTNNKSIILKKSDIYKFFNVNKEYNLKIYELIIHVKENNNLNFYNSLNYILKILNNKKIYFLFKKKPLQNQY